MDRECDKWQALMGMTHPVGFIKCWGNIDEGKICQLLIKDSMELIIIWFVIRNE